jgi:uncharacterized protein (DUF305 family)
MIHTLRRVALPVLGAAAALTLAACGGSSSSGSGGGGMPGMPGMTGSMSSTATAAPTGSPAAGAHNQADVAFATGMIPHHRQAVTMAELALTKATNPTVKQLATAIKAAQDPEIKTMSGWLQGWGQPVPAATGGGMSQMGSATTDSSGMGGMGGMGGMMTDAEMSQLSNASGAAFDRMWLQMMIKHHTGAVAMAQTELSTGGNQDAKQLAQSIIDDQTKEITTMTALLGTLPS